MALQGSRSHLHGAKCVQKHGTTATPFLAHSPLGAPIGYRKHSQATGPLNHSCVWLDDENWRGNIDKSDKMSIEEAGKNVYNVPVKRI